jgi:antitoxin (DNA-binding transcriptional repressor) of toxin-antitoxin stability system
MIQIPETQAVKEFSMLLNKVVQGQEVIIIGTDGSVFKLVALPRAPKPIFGSVQGLVSIGPDFDEPVVGTV